jgi:hypothetical protein
MPGEVGLAIRDLKPARSRMNRAALPPARVTGDEPVELSCRPTTGAEATGLLAADPAAPPRVLGTCAASPGHRDVAQHTHTRSCSR